MAPPSLYPADRPRPSEVVPNAAKLSARRRCQGWARCERNRCYSGDRPRSSKESRGSVAQSVTGGTDVFALGRIGESTQVIPPELVDSVLDGTGAREQRRRSLPSRVGVYLVRALGLFEYLGTALVWGKLTSGLDARAPQPSGTR
ncbi:transposase domain-containing protein [Streptomyces diastatochromogenes]|uniref:transposase domain-containing protein n=1 Tax=Streptomyces diastatochromogenes TaxID=42236 RepID=UPI003664810D